MELGLPLQYLQQRTTSTEFVEWQRVLTLRELKTQRQDWLVARLCWEIRRSSGERNLPPLERLLVSFTTEAQKEEERKLSEEQEQRKMRNSDAAWGFFFSSARAKINKQPLRVLKFPKEAG